MNQYKSFSPRPLAVLISAALASGAHADLCPAPMLDDSLNVHIPCLMSAGEAYQVVLQAHNHPQELYWSLYSFAPATCEPHISACLNPASDLSMNFPRVDGFGFRYTAQLQQRAAFTWGLVNADYSTIPQVSESAVELPLGAAEGISFAGSTKPPMVLSMGIGSGAYHFPGDSAEVLYTVTDRGPNIGCGDSETLLGVVDFCRDNGTPDSAGKIFPVPEFAPSIFKFHLTDNGYEVMERIELKDRNGNPISGLSNPLTVTNTENAYDPQGGLRPLDPEGVDTEALVRLSNGSFWLADEYGPSLIHVAADGTIVNRLVPAGMEADLAAAEYTVSGVLPTILKNRQLNRGMESVAVSPDEQYLYFVMQSPLANPDANAYKASRNVRLFKLRLNSDGSMAAIIGEYVYPIDPPQSYVQDASSKQSDVKVSEMTALATDDLVVLERISKNTKLYRVNLTGAENIFGSAWDNEATTPSLEQSMAGFTPLAKSQVFDSLTDSVNLSAKIEGVALLDDHNVALVNDNDFGIAGDHTTIHVLPLYAQLHAGIGVPASRVKLTQLARYSAGQFAESAAEIVAYCPSQQRLFVVNAHLAKVDVLDVSAAALESGVPVKIGELDASGHGAGVNSVSTKNGIVAVAVENTDKQANGKVVFFNAENFSEIAAVEVGALPDMVTFTPDGEYVLVANEGEPGNDYTNDPVGSVSVIKVADFSVRHATFDAFDAATLRAQDVRVFGPNASAAQDLEPEYIAIAPDSSRAFVNLQENNAIAVVDIATASVTKILPLHFKDHGVMGNELDASNKDGGIHLANWPVWGMYLPDSIAAYNVAGVTYLVTANEGDSRDYDGYSEEARIKDLILDAEAFPQAEMLQADENLGRLKVTTSLGDDDGDGDYDRLFSYGARSFSIWSTEGNLIFDSGAAFERITANLLGAKGFNADSEENGGDERSDDKGPEPEALTLGEIDGETFAFIGLERAGGIMVYNITDPYHPHFTDYVNNRDWTATPGETDVGDLAPEGMAFIPAAKSPTGKPLLAVANEVSGTTTVYQVDIVR